MKTIKWSILLIVVINLSCANDDILQPEEKNEPIAEIIFKDDSSVYDLNGEWSNKDFYIKNVSNSPITLSCRNINNYLYEIAYNLTLYENNKWITIENISADSAITVLPDSSEIATFWFDLVGSYKIEVPINNNEFIVSCTKNVINSIENEITFSIKQSTNKDLVEIFIQNESEHRIQLHNAHYPYCHFSYLSYEIFEDGSYNQLYWNDTENKWSMENYSVGVICFAEAPEIFLESGQIFSQEMSVDLPTGLISARLNFWVGSEDSLETISKTFEYQ
ncbi:MAG: hypothetical protein K9J12_05260 [Melioribacteraceae bacterium]|nr:hypothetical protein [Melioribacteraceae bacterium]MCF8262984.1 hypothetical protein [Melioribacteraceae bacterium]MCF8430583.1 hypothetical protein [Melioribacteraceae bacterium]